MSNRRRIRALRNAGQEQDGRYFTDHPAAHGYTRPATPAELRATGFPPGTQVYVARLGRDTRVRGFLPPNVRRN